MIVKLRFALFCLANLAIVSFGSPFDNETLSRTDISPLALAPISPGDNSFWPGATIYYSIDSSFNNYDRTELSKAIADYQTKTCIRWVPRTNQAEYLTFIKDPNQGGAAADNCYTLGRRLDARFCPTCTNAGTQIHEMGHALCFGHEQARNDRDDYLSSDNCIEGKYEHINGGHLYDYLSIMHYGCNDRCLVPKLNGVARCGSPSDRLSVLDAEKLNDMYKCTGCRSYKFRFIEQIQGDPNSNPMPAGYELNGEPLYICRVYHNGDIIPGKGSVSKKFCYISYGGAEYFYNTINKYEIFTNPQRQNFKWVRQSQATSIPSNAIPGGRTTNGETLYIGRCIYRTSDGRTTLIPGKIHQPSPSFMYIAFNGREERCYDYEILIC